MDLLKRQHVFLCGPVRQQWGVFCISRAAAALSQPLFWLAHRCLILTECHPYWGYFWNNMHKELVAGPHGHIHTTPRDPCAQLSLRLIKVSLFCIANLQLILLYCDKICFEFKLICAAAGTCCILHSCCSGHCQQIYTNVGANTNPFRV